MYLQHVLIRFLDQHDHVEGEPEELGLSLLSETERALLIRKNYLHLRGTRKKSKVVSTVFLNTSKYVCQKFHLTSVHLKRGMPESY